MRGGDGDVFSLLAFVSQHLCINVILCICELEGGW
jgi:hypothetical protein